MDSKSDGGQFACSPHVPPLLHPQSKNMYVLVDWRLEIEAGLECISWLCSSSVSCKFDKKLTIQVQMTAYCMDSKAEK